MAARNGLFVFVLAVAVVVAVDALDVIEKHAQILKTCLEDGKVTADDMKAFADKDKYPDALKCALKCLLISVKAMNEEDGAFNLEAISLETHKGFEEPVKKCLEKVSKTDLCDRAEEYHICLRDQQPELFKQTVIRVVEAM